MRARWGLPEMRQFAAGSLSRNTIAALIQALLVSLCLFIVYRIVVSNVGLDGLGIWSLLMIGSTVARVGDLSGGAALARFIAPLDRTSDADALADIVDTVILTSLAIMLLMCGALLAFVPMLLPRILPEASLPLARSPLPLVCAIIIVSGVSTVIMSGLDGFQRADQRAILMSVGAILMLAIAALLVPAMGLAGFAWAQFSSQLLVTLAGWALLRRHLPLTGWLPTRWRAAAFSKTFSFGLKLNGIMVLTLFFEPLVKLALNEAGDTTRVALYELASRIVTQVRSLVVSAASPLMPAIA
jgi:O-antigen/teichoic acid export membrane protein